MQLYMQGSITTGAQAYKELKQMEKNMNIQITERNVMHLKFNKFERFLIFTNKTKENKER